MILLLTMLLCATDAPAYPLYVTGSSSSVKKFVDIINSELPAGTCVYADHLDPSSREYGIRLVRKTALPDLGFREDRFFCGINYVLGDSAKSFRIKLVADDPQVLIGDGVNATFDIADIGKFNTSFSRDYTAGNVLLHELYEQYCLQVVSGATPGRITSVQLKRAHQRAVQKESLLFDLLAVKTHTDVVDDHSIYIEFTNRRDSTRISYVAYYNNGNIEWVEQNILY